MKYILLYGDKMYLLNSLLLTSDKETIKKIYLKVYNFLCHDNIEDIETFELINGEISTDEVFIQKLFNTIIINMTNRHQQTCLYFCKITHFRSDMRRSVGLFGQISIFFH